ncbi:MAG: hypothetical protein HY804_05090 [Nitrospinae bacterium]|nr:hypothetical protein [Nitrospinota bacterium]
MARRARSISARASPMSRSAARRVALGMVWVTPIIFCVISSLSSRQLSTGTSVTPSSIIGSIHAIAAEAPSTAAATS